MKVLHDSYEVYTPVVFSLFHLNFAFPFMKWRLLIVDLKMIHSYLLERLLVMVRYCEVGCLNQGNESVIVHLSFLQCSFRPCVVAELNGSSILL